MRDASIYEDGIFLAGINRAPVPRYYLYLFIAPQVRSCSFCQGRINFDRGYSTIGADDFRQHRRVIAGSTAEVKNPFPRSKPKGVEPRSKCAWIPVGQHLLGIEEDRDVLIQLGRFCNVDRLRPHPAWRWLRKDSPWRRAN